MPSVKHETWVLLSLGLLFPALAYAADHLPLPAVSANADVVSLGAFTALPDRLTAAATGPAREPQATSSPANVEAAATALTPQEPQSTALAGMGPSISADSLDQYRGGTAITSEAVSNGLLQDATATNIATGNNSIAGGAFANTFGLPIVIQNSGANVLIQNSTIVNVQFR